MKVFLATACFGILSCGAALAQDGFTSWGNSGDWDIMVDPEVGYGCFMQKSFDDGTVVQVGAVPDRQGGFFAALNAAWTEITDGQEGVLTFDFGDAKFAGDALGVIRNGVPGGYAFF